ncbi:MAG: ABC transporter substrate-binding protein [Firmicutes bacterium]|nr:ABC transporter substrate-binding protein [Bacillota bacterium]
MLSAVALAVLMVAGLAAEAQPARGGHLTVAQSAEPPLLNPSATTATAATSIVHHNVLEGLVKVDRSGALTPGLAESWTVSPDATEYVFRLRRGVRFHNGQEFTSADVKAKFERARDPESGHTNQRYYTSIASIETPDPYTVIFRMSEPDAEFLYNLARPDSVIVPAGTEDTQGVHPVGTGPFRFVEWVRGSHVRLERFEDYWNQPLPYLDSVTFRFITDPNTQVAALLAGDIDAVTGAVTAEQALRVQQAGGFQVIQGPTTNTVILAMNNSRPPLDDVRVRRAITHAINREEVMIGAEFGFGTPIGSHMTPAEPYYADMTGVTPYDPDRARALLAEAGYADGLELTLSLPVSYTYALRSGEIAAGQLARVGIRVNIELVEWSTWLSRIFGQADYDLTVIGHAEPMDIGIYGNPDYYFRYDSAAVRELLAEAKRVGDEERRREVYAQIQRQLAEDAVNVWLYARPYFILSRADVDGWWDRLPMVITDVTEVHFSR